MSCELTKQEQIASWLTSKVASGEIESGDMIPPEISLAKEFQVNRSTVSKALDSLKRSGILLRRAGKGSFVADGAKALLKANSVPQEQVSRQRPPRVAMLGVVMESEPRYLNGETWRIQRSFERKMSQLAPGASVSFHNLHPKAGPQGVRSLMEGFLKSGVQGVCLIEDSIAKDDLVAFISELKVAEMPFVVSATDSRREWVDRVSCSHHGIGFSAAKLLHSLGHKAFAFAAPDFDFPWVDERLSGFKEYLSAKGIRPDDILVVKEAFGGLSHWPDSARDCGARCGRKLLVERRFSAIFAANDLIAAGIMDAAKEMGVAIPEDFSLIGVDNAKTLDLNITSIPLPFEDIGETSAGLLLKKMTQPSSRGYVEQIFVLPELVERLTTSRPQAVLGASLR